MTATFRAAIFAAVFLSTTGSLQPVRAQSCPYFNSKDIDRWFLATTQISDWGDQKLACVDDPGFITFDFLNRSAPRSFFLDVTFATRWTRAKYALEASPTTIDLKSADGEITSQEASACRRQIVTSRAWNALGCPTN